MAQSADSAENGMDLDALGELNSTEARALFDMVDELSALGVGRIVDLPQIIVVGDQSAGKSTVLGAISQVHFPVDGGVCTRFATELVLSPSHRRHIQAAVRFENSSKPTHTLRVDNFDQKDIQQIIVSAKEQMGLSGTKCSRDYSKDVLRLELEGPEICHLTLVDLPGIYHNETDDQSPEGIQVVMDIVTRYMKKSNSIILAIISASGGFANQAVMREAAKHDPARERTLGVVTKPDLLPAGSDLQKEYLQLVRNAQTTHKLKLGWHIVRNRADYEDDRSADAIENDFFRAGPWSSISASNRGIIALRKKLSKLLYEHIKKSLPTVISDIQRQLTEREDELTRLGQPRSTTGSMRLYLTAAGDRFRDLVLKGTQGHYADQFFGELNDQSRKLRAQLRNWNRAIWHVLLNHGSAYDVLEEDGHPLGVSSRRYMQTLPLYLTGFTYDDLPVPRIITRAKLAKKLESQAAINQGTEHPGYPNMGLATQLFQKQTKQWESLATQHLEKVVSAVRDFIEHVVLEVTGPNERTRIAILSVYVEPFFDAKHDTLLAKLQEILRPFKNSYSLARVDDFQDAMRDMARKRKLADQDRNTQAGDTAAPGTLAAQQFDDGEFGTELIVDTVQTFCQMSLQTFTDNLINLVIESCLVEELPGIFSPNVVATMDDEQLSSFASEEDGVAEYRSQLQTDITLLKQGLDLCRQNMPRNLTGRTTSTTNGTQSHRAADRSDSDTIGSSSPGVAEQAPSSRASPLKDMSLVSRPVSSTQSGKALASTRPASFGVTSTNGKSTQPTGSQAQAPKPASVAPAGRRLFEYHQDGSDTSSDTTSPPGTSSGSAREPSTPHSSVVQRGSSIFGPPQPSNNTGSRNAAPSGGLFARSGGPSTAQPTVVSTVPSLFSSTQSANNTAFGSTTPVSGSQVSWANAAAPVQQSSIFSNNGSGLFGNLGKAAK